MKKSKFFASPLPTNADIKRHRKTRKDLIDNINSLELSLDRDYFEEAMLSQYKRLLALLEQSNAEIVNKIGKKE